jgi:hypothetical protein
VDLRGSGICLLWRTAHPAESPSFLCAWCLQEEETVLIGAFIKRVMDECPCDDDEWAEEWLEEEGHIDEMLEDGWTLQTVQDIPIHDIAKDMAAALWRSKSTCRSEASSIRMIPPGLHCHLIPSSFPAILPNQDKS